MSEITELRRSLRESGARFAVIKNTLMRRALEGTDAAGLKALFEGPSAVAFVKEDPVAAAKSVTNAAKKFPTLVLKGGFVEGRLLSADQAKALADLESRDVMLSKVAGLIKSEITRAAGTFQAAQARFLSLLEAFKSVLEAFKAKLPAEPEARAAEQPADQHPEEPGQVPILGTAAGKYGNATAASYGIGMKYNNKGTNPQGQIQLILTRSDGTYFIKSNSISSVAFANEIGTQPSKDVTIYIGQASTRSQARAC